MSIRRSARDCLRQLAMIAVVFALTSVVSTSGAAADPGSIPGPASDRAARDTAVADVIAQLGKPARLDVKQFHVADGWGFVSATILSPDGGFIDYQGTKFAEAAANGGVSKSYVGLLHDNTGRWRIVTSRVGPTDVAWEKWSSEYGAPKSIFVFS